jgi:iron complex outermembrane receptor protein
MRHFTARLLAGSALPIVLLAAAPAFAEDQPSSVDEVIVTGTRETSRTPFTALAPVDLLSAQTLRQGASAQFGESLAQVAPAFNVKRLPTSDGLQFIRPASLRNLSPDMTLVLLNGKRFHRSGFLGTRGAQSADLAQIPNFAVGRAEVLRDGASAQYGSDAIAGVINIILDTKPGYGFYVQGSRYYEGDGATGQIGARAGFGFDSGAHIVVTAEYNKADLTSRSAQRQDAINFSKASGIAVANPVQRWGNPETRNTHLSFDAAAPLTGEVEGYAFGTYGKGEGVNDINWRNPAANPTIYKVVPIFPGFDLNKIYPAGFTPHEGVNYDDSQLVLGMRDKTGDLTWDLSASAGRNDSQFFLKNSINASLGPASPFEFDLGHQQQGELNFNADATYLWTLEGLASPLTVAFGAEQRTETYKIIKGDAASYAVGPAAAAGLAPLSNGFPGFSPQQAGKWKQTSHAAYVDVSGNMTDAWSLDVAGRVERFPIFGESYTGKIATRYEFSPAIAMRASYSTGFRAPTPGQQNSTASSQGLDTVTLQLFTSGRLSPLDPVARFLGAKPLTPEKSKTATLGMVWKTSYGFSGSADVYNIDVTDRFSTSPTITVTPAIRAQLVAQNVPGATSFTSLSYFTNDFDTRTRGIDLVGAYTRAIGPGRMDLSVAYNHNQTKVTGGSLASAANTTAKRNFEEGIPKDNLTASATYAWDKIAVTGRARYYGSWTDSTGNATGEIFQSFGGFTTFDLSASYQATENLSVRIGAENIFDAYPDKAVFQASRGLVYSRNSPYDTNGGLYYVRLEGRF